MTQTPQPPRDWQKDMERAQFFKDADKYAVGWTEPLIYWIQEAKERGEREQRLKEAIQAAHQSLTWCNTDKQIPHAVWHLEQALSLYPDTPAQEEGK